MSNGGKRLNELIKERGFIVGAVAKAIGVGKNAMNGWGENAPIGKLIKISEFTHIPLDEIIVCFRPDRIAPTHDELDEN